jgi:hypothetical protein
VPRSNESDLLFNAPDEIAQVQPYGAQEQTLTPVAYGYDAARIQIQMPAIVNGDELESPGIGGLGASATSATGLAKRHLGRVWVR